MARSWAARWRTWHLWPASLGAGLTLLFAITGFLLNHPEWFGRPKARPATTIDITLPEAVTQGDRLTIVEHLRASTPVRGAVQSYEADEGFIYITFATPRQESSVDLDLEAGTGTVHIETDRFTVLLGNLHMGSNTPAWWGLVIDLTAILMALSAITGLALLASLPKQRRKGLIIVAVGTALPFVAVLMTLL